MSWKTDPLQDHRQGFNEVYEIVRSAIVSIDEQKYKIDVLKAHHYGPGEELYYVDVYYQIEVYRKGVKQEHDGKKSEVQLKEYVWAQYIDFPAIQERDEYSAAAQALNWLRDRHQKR